MNLLTVKQLAEILRVSEKTLYQWAEAGQIPRLKLNGTVRFDDNDIEAWLASCKKAAVPGYNPLTKLEARRKGGKQG